METTGTRSICYQHTHPHTTSPPQSPPAPRLHHAGQTSARQDITQSVWLIVSASSQQNYAKLKMRACVTANSMPVAQFYQWPAHSPESRNVQNCLLEAATVQQKVSLGKQ